jgi:hypothetical protein
MPFSVSADRSRQPLNLRIRAAQRSSTGKVLSASSGGRVVLQHRHGAGQ